MERIRFSLSRTLLRMLAAASGIAASAFLLVACNGNSSGKSDADNLPFQGEWHKPGAEHILDISYSRIQFIDQDDMNPILVFAPYSPETPDNPDRLTFLYDDNYPGTVVYDRSKQSVTLTIKGLMDDGSDYVITFDPSDRLDRITPYVGAEYRLIYSSDDKSPIDTLYRGESVRWVDDTLNKRRVQLADGRKGYMEFNTARTTRGIPTDLAYRETYKYSRPDEYTDRYSFERKGNHVIVIYNHLPADAYRAEEYYYLGEIDGHKINVDKSFISMPDINEDIISAATPIDTPFTISIIDNDDEPYIVIDGKAYKVDNF